MVSIPALLGLAFAPGVYLAIIIYGKDKYDREPKMILLKAFLLGALAVVPAAFIEVYYEKYFGSEDMGIWYAAITAFIFVAFTEEILKFLALRFHAYRLPEFNEPFDGIVYAAFVGLGFATAENLAYVLKGGLQVAVVRMFTSVPAHYAFGVIMGYYVGKAKFEPAKRTLYMFQAVFYATFMHGAYDFFLMQQQYPGLSILTLGVLIMAIRIARRSITEMQADSVFRMQARMVTEENPPNEGPPL